MADQEELDGYSLDLQTGEVTYKGIVYTFQDLIDEWEAEDDDAQDAAANLRDVSSDIQNLWGTKKDKFKDNWKNRIRPLRRRKGYPREL